jgi:hypothetical protein
MNSLFGEMIERGMAYFGPLLFFIVIAFTGNPVLKVALRGAPRHTEVIYIKYDF